jgi:Asp-tRNA(Asn)/Glu-tRNA(Gln) amidotransferase A subunit family amidase
VPADGQIPDPPADSPRRRFSLIGPVARTVSDIRAALVALGRAAPSTHRLPRCAWLCGEGTVPIPDELARPVCAAARSLTDAGYDAVEIPQNVLADGEALFSELRARDDYRDLRALAADRPQLLSDRIADLLAARTGDAPIETLERRLEGLRARVVELMRERPVILLPVAATGALALGAKTVELDGAQTPVNDMKFLAPCRAISALGLPALSLPAGRDHDGRPIGIQIAGRPGCEGDVLAVAAFLEQTVGDSGVAPSG